ncbi:MAG: division/cell wall cluster transcriptional repressor MraZ [Candidatus Nanopelagicales bacterium]|jgi:MraZ protein|nr:transcriptional regulator MraZ [Actinomycetota bacterium]
MFLGTHEPRLDDKGRLVLPAKFRDGFSTDVVLTKGQDLSIVMWPLSEFQLYAQKIREASRNDARVRSYLRVFFSSAFDEQIDKQGRITLPAALRDYAQLDRDVIVVGADTTVEIWDPKLWNTYLSEAEPKFASTQEEVVPGIF